MERLILRTTALCTRRPWWVVAAWVVLALVALPFAGRAQGRLSSGGFEVPGSQSQTAIDYLNALPGRGAYSFSFLVDANTPEAARARAAEVRAEVTRRYPIIRFRTRPQVSPDGRTISFLGFAPIDQNRSLHISRDLEGLVQHTSGPVRTYLLGPSANFAAFQDITERGLKRAETLSSPIILIVLLVLFGAVVATLVPAGLGAVSVAIAFAIVYGIAAQTEVSVYATTMVTMIGVGVAVDYSMFILARFREELLAGVPTADAVESAMRSSGTAVAFSGMTVVVSLASVWIVPVRALQSMALAAVIVVAIAVLAGMTLLPAVLMLLGPRINGLRVPAFRRREGSAFWLGWSRRVMRRPLLSAGSAAAVLIVLALPAALAASLRDRLVRDPLIAAATLERAGPSVLVVGQLRVDPESSLATDTLVPRVRSWVGSSGLVSGVSAFNYDLNQQVGGDLWKVMALVLGLSYLVLLALLRSVVLPLKAVIMNLLSIGASYGVIVAVFQWGWFDWTGYHSLGHINTLTPALILATTFGLAMDYEVFLLSRIRERYEACGDNERAVAEGLASSARIITSAATIMTVVFASFVLTGVPAIKEIGLGLAVAIAVDATVTRLVLVPATMRLLGQWNWWLPRWLDRRLPYLAHEPPGVATHAGD